MMHTHAQKNAEDGPKSVAESMAQPQYDVATPIQKKENRTGLPDNLKAGIENLSGYSMDDVKVHYGSHMPAQMQAHAYAQGTDIHLAPGQEKHLPHEAWHVAQQKQGRVKPTKQLKSRIPINDDTGLENEADRMGARAMAQNTPADSGPLLQRKQLNTGTVQRYVTFNARQEEPAMLGEGFAGYGENNIDLLAEELSKHGVEEARLRERLAPYLGAGKSVSFRDFEDAAAFVNGETDAETLPPVVHEKPKAKASGSHEGYITAYRVDGGPKSKKQESDVQKLAPNEAFSQTMRALAIAPEIQPLLKGSWENLLKSKNPGKFLKNINNDYRKQIRDSKGFDPASILAQMGALNEQLKAELAETRRLASRLQIDGAHVVPRKEHEGTITGISETASFNFSVGRPDHAMYFNSTYKTPNTQLIKFFLKKDAWRTWKIEQTGPQISALGPSAENPSTTLNDVTEPGVKYEVKASQVRSFLETVVATEIPAQVVPMERQPFNPNVFLDDTLLRLQKANDKLTRELEAYKGEKDTSAERTQNETANRVLAPAPGSKVGLDELYSALSLTKNALHSVRRKAKPPTALLE